MLKASFKKYHLYFKTPVLTSRGVMAVKNGYYLFIRNETKAGTGECSFIEGLSIDDLENYETVLTDLCRGIETGNENLFPDFNTFPSIAFGYQTALLDFETGGNKILFNTDFTKGKTTIPINGLVWMGTKDFMQQQIEQKLKDGFGCIKLKVGALDFKEELNLLQFIRSKFPEDIIEIRLDANGAFTPDTALQRLDELAEFQIHSIEQPVKQGQPHQMAKLCKQSPIPVALDEELIGITGNAREEILKEIQPAYIILKPSLLGGITACEDWISVARKQNIPWWATSALESNIGLNAIAQWVSAKNNQLAQGLGTGGLYTHNVDSPLYVAKGCIGYNPKIEWAEVK